MVSTRQGLAAAAAFLLGVALLGPVPGGVSADRRLTGPVSAPAVAVGLEVPLLDVDLTAARRPAAPAVVGTRRVVPVAPGRDGTGAPRASGGTEPDASAAAVTVSIIAAGDVLPHDAVLSAAQRGHGFDFRPLLAGVRGPVAAADLALCHLEVPLTRDLGALSGYPVFNAPHQLAAALASVGFDGCSVASNHALDQGGRGVASTLRALAAADLGATGTARSPRERRRIRLYGVRGVDVAHLSFTYGLNGRTAPPRPWMVNIIDPRTILADARRARRQGADAVVVSLHWGREYRSTPTPAQRRLAAHLLASPAVDVIIGHHAHVVQPVAQRHGKVVAYGLGNLLSNQTARCCVAAAQDGVLLRLILRRRPAGDVRVERVEYLPTMVRHPGRRVVLVRPALDRVSTPADRRRLRASLRRTRSAIGDLAVPAR